ncbi:MAG: glycosyltransferase family 39 protein, partial [Candidatus Hydrogenedentota bacterium]
AQSTGRRMAKALFISALSLLLFAFFSVIALKRPADVDEGYHLVCSKSIFVEGRTPYIDFFFFQMPLLPYVYGGIMSLFGYQWQVARLVCAFLAAAIGTLLCRYAFQKTGSMSFAASIAVIYCFAPYIFIWFTCARTHVLSVFFLVISISLLRPMTTRASVPLWTASGFFLGLGIDTRLYFLALVPVLAFHVSQVEKEKALRAVPFFLGGVAMGLTINIPFLAADPMKYLLNVIGYHALKTSDGLIGSFGQKVDLLRQTLFDYPALRPTLYLGYVIVFAAYLGQQVYRRTPLSAWNPAFYVGGTLFLVSLLPTPTLGQYFSVPVPFFLILAIDLVQTVFEYLKADYAKRTAAAAVALGAVLFACLAAGKVDFYIFKGNNLEGSMPTEGGREDWNLANVERVSRAIDSLVGLHGVVFSLWPGYLLESDVRIMPRTENVTLLEIEDRLSERIRSLSQTITDDEIRKGIATREIDLFIYGNSIAPHVSEYKALLTGNGYTVAEKIGGISLFMSPQYEGRAYENP